MRVNRLGSILPIAVMAFAVVSFLFVITWAVMPNQKWPWSTLVSTKNTNLVACTDEAKLCPDGSYVGRTGPNCEFAVCPNVNGNTNLTVIANTNSSTTVACSTDADCAPACGRC